MRVFRAAVLFVIFILAIFGYFIFMPVQSEIKEREAQSKPSKVSEFFDHSQCQYPDRWTNPIDGCDNSDAAVPECIKAFSTEQGEKDCIAEFVKQNDPANIPNDVYEGK